MDSSLTLFDSAVTPPQPPPTRYQGSKYKLLGWIWDIVSNLDFETVLDGFGGTGCVSHFLKGKGKTVTFNDILVSNCLGAKALVENDNVILSSNDVHWLTQRHADVNYDDFIERTFSGIYFTNEENYWLDTVVRNIPLLDDEYKQAIAYYALFQSCISKRPFNLFHRKNLYIRLAEVERSFGNKATWDKPFNETYRHFTKVANQAIFIGNKRCIALNSDIIEVQGCFDLVYLDPPYMNSRGVGVDYYDFYHFLEGLADYPNWLHRIDFGSKHRRLKHLENPWTKRGAVHDIFERTFRKFKDSLLVLSYRSDGIPSIDDLVKMMERHWPTVTTHSLDGSYTYVLSTNKNSTEVILVGTR